MKVSSKNLSTTLLVLSAMLVPMYFTDLRLSVGGVIIRFSDIMSLGIIALFSVCYRNGWVHLYLPKGFFLISFFLIYCFTNALLQAGFFKSLVATFQWLLILSTLVVVYTHSVMYPDKFARYFYFTLLFICCFVVFYHFSIGKFYHYKNLGDSKYVLSLTGVLILSYVYFYQDKRYLFVLFILYPFILLSLERKGILAFHVVLFLYICASYKKVLQLSCVILFFSVLLMLFISPELFEMSSIKIFEYSEYEMLALDEEQALWVSNLHRQSLIENGWDIFNNNYVFGIGPKMLPDYMAEYYFNPQLGLYTHNVFLDSLVEQGIVGLFLLLIPYVFFIIKTKFNSLRQLFCFFILSIYSVIMLMFMSGGAPSMILMFFPLLTSYLFSESSHLVMKES